MEPRNDRLVPEAVGGDRAADAGVPVGGRDACSDDNVLPTCEPRLHIGLIVEKRLGAQ